MATEAFSVAILVCRPCVAIEIQCRDKDLCVATLFPGMLGGLGHDRGLLCRYSGLSALFHDKNSVSRQGLGLGQAWVATRVSLCRNRVFPRVGYSYRDIIFYVATGFSKVVLRQGVFLS